MLKVRERIECQQRRRQGGAEGAAAAAAAPRGAVGGRWAAAKIPAGPASVFRGEGCDCFYGVESASSSFAS